MRKRSLLQVTMLAVANKCLHACAGGQTACRIVTVAPDWVLEVLSPSTMAYDLGHKQRIYHQCHVGHYWLAHPHPINPLLQVYRWHELGYLLVLAAGVGDAVHAEPFDAIELDIARVLAWPPSRHGTRAHEP